MATVIGNYYVMDTETNDFPANASTPGHLDYGITNYGVISPSGDVDWFGATLLAGVSYRITITAGSINGLFDPQMALLGGDGSLILRATVGQGCQSKYFDYTPQTTGTFFVAASGDPNVTGSYQLLVTPSGPYVGGTPGADTLVGTPANDIIDGGLGLDTVVYAGSRAQYAITQGAGHIITVADSVSNRDGTDTLLGTEQIRFSDMTLVFDLTSSADLNVYKLYQAAYARTPDNAGFRYWAGIADTTGMSALNLADQFLAAPEFTQKYGANPSNLAYATAMYANILGRSPDSAGLAYWVSNLDKGEARDQLLVDFALSAENATLIGSHVSNGFWTT